MSVDANPEGADAADQPSEREVLIELVRQHENECSDDELRVICAVYKRIELGRSLYGRLDVARDPRNWSRELAEELLDAVVYAAIVQLAGRRAS